MANEDVDKTTKKSKQRIQVVKKDDSSANDKMETLKQLNANKNNNELLERVCQKSTTNI